MSNFVPVQSLFDLMCGDIIQYNSAGHTIVAEIESVCDNQYNPFYLELISETPEYNEWTTEFEYNPFMLYWKESMNLQVDIERFMEIRQREQQKLAALIAEIQSSINQYIKQK